MPFTYRDKPKLSDRFRGKSGEEIFKELTSDLDRGRRMFFDSPSWRHNPSGFPRRFPFADDRKRVDIRSHLDEIAARYPEFADQLREPDWNEDFNRPSSSLNRPGRNSDSGREGNFNREDASGSNRGVQETSGQQSEQQNLSNFGLRNTVPLGPGTAAEGERHQRSMSAPPDSRTSEKPKKFVTKCEIPIMQDPTQEPAAAKPEPAGANSQNENVQQKMNSSPNVRVIPIQVEGRETPLVNTNFDSATNFAMDATFHPREGSFEGSFDGRLPRDFGAYQKHSPRFAHKEKPCNPPHQHYAPQQQYVPPPHQQHYGPPPHQQHYGPPPHQQNFPPFHQQYAPQQQFVPPQQHHQQHQQQQQPQFHQGPNQQHHSEKPPAPPPAQHKHQQPQPPANNAAQQVEEIDSKPPVNPTKPEPIKDPMEKVLAVQKEVEELMKKVEAFNGNSRMDKQYLILDELLTRELLQLDDIDTEGKENVRQARKDTIRSIQRCISTLENKVPTKEGNSSEVDTNEGNVGSAEVPGGGGGGGAPAPAPASAPQQQTMEVDVTKEGSPANSKDSQKMEVDEGAAVKEAAPKVQGEQKNKGNV